MECKSRFYSELSNVLNNINHGDIKILMGDFNAQVGSDNRNRENVMGKHGLGHLSENGELLLEVCDNFNLVLGGTLFPHKQIHKVSWVSPDRLTENQIDHIAISKMWRGSLLDVRNKRGADVASDHHLIVADIRLKLRSVIRNNRSMRRSLDITKLKNHDTCNNFTNKLKEKVNNLSENEEIEEYCKKITSAFTETAINEIGYTKKDSKPWISNTTWEHIVERKQLKAEINKANSPNQKGEKLRQYNSEDKKVKRSARKDRRNWIQSLAEEAEKACQTGRLKDLYKITKQIAGNNKCSAKPLKNENGILTCDKDKQLKIWEKYYKGLLTTSNNENINICDCDPKQHTNNIREDINVLTPTPAEISEAVQQLKSGKAAGPDGIPPEILKIDIQLTTRCLRRIYGIYWPNTITNNALWNMSNQQPLEDEIKGKKYRWLGHTMRKASTDVTKQLIEYNPQGGWGGKFSLMAGERNTVVDGFPIGVCPNAANRRLNKFSGPPRKNPSAGRNVVTVAKIIANMKTVENFISPFSLSYANKT
ncbi:uncharacterized protein [Musca autumnalis]|uniref:uncharacterized protein n=1 Tax=Musca autumnalis TaxID=221902 RepID=UPI003CF1A524